MELGIISLRVKILRSRLKIIVACTKVDILEPKCSRALPIHFGTHSSWVVK